jgi:hypothetical protein
MFFVWLSHVQMRVDDFKRLLHLQYPIRCRRCHRRDYARMHLILLQALEQLAVAVF